VRKSETPAAVDGERDAVATLAASPQSPPLRFHLGAAGALLPFFVFVAGVVTLALSGAPDERGFWPVLILALSLGLVLARDRERFCEEVIAGMSQPIVMIMVMAWLLASTIGVLMRDTQLVEGLIWLAGRFNLQGAAFVAAAFLVCCTVSTATGTSFGTILICGPILYPAGGLLGAHLPTLAGAILGGATFGDSISPISDTTIASAFSQRADIAGTVRSRVKYVVPAAALAMVAYVATGAGATSRAIGTSALGDPRGLPMVLAPIVIIGLLLARRHLLYGLLAGLITGVAIGLATGLLPVDRVLSLDRENFTARSFVIDGITRGVGISVFTILLIGLVSAIEASGVLQRIVDISQRRTHTARGGEAWIVGVVGVVVLLTCHSIVAILTVGDFARQTGERFGIHAYRRANLLDLTVSTFPFLLPYFIPVLLAAGTTASGTQYGVPAVPALAVGMHNFFSWITLIIIVVAVVTGYGRRFAADA
jgi:Na+/H+ antiporter NhaC